MSENLPPLYYPSGNKSELLPEWAYFFMRLGYQLATISNDSHRFVIGVAIPTRSFASSLVGIGVVLGKANKETRVDEARFQYIRNLESGTSVYVRIGNRKHKAVVERFEENNGQIYIVICTTASTPTSKPLKRKLPLDRYASKITVSHKDVSLSGKQSGQRMEPPSEFIQNCLGKELAKEYIHNSLFEALVVGKKSVIQHEVCDIPFICKTSGKSSADVKGYLQEILRVRQFSGTNKSYRTQCISPSNITPEKEIGTQTPPIVVFDGAIAYIKLSHKWRSAHQVALLDRTERQFVDAIELLNQNYAYRLAGDFKFPIRIPDGIEMTVYRDSVR